MSKNARQIRTIRAVVAALVVAGILGIAALTGGVSRIHAPAEDPLASPPYPVMHGDARPLAWCVRQGVPVDAQSFDELDLSGFWHSILLPVVGACEEVTLDVLTLPPPPRVRLLVLSASAALGLEQASVAQRESLLRWVSLGGVLWVERPGVTLLSQLDPRVHALTVAQARGVVMQDPIIFPTFSFMRVAGKPSGQVFLTTLPEQGAEPLAWTVPHGQGVVLICLLELSRVLAQRVQGHPRPDFSFEPVEREGALRGIPVPTDLVAKNPEWTGPVVLELIERMWAITSQQVFLPAWWRHPQGRPGTFVMTHDEEAFGDRSIFMAEEEARLGKRSSTFVLPAPLSSAGARALERHGMELLLHWHRGFLGGNTEPIRVGPLVVGSRALSLQEQRARVEGLVGRTLPPLTRIHGLQWDADWDSTFRRLVAAGFQLDSSYGPVGEQSSWRFGTLEPFFPLDRQGRVLPLLEFPFALQDDEAAPYERLKALVARAGDEHLTVVPIVHVNTMAYKPSMGALEAYLESFGWADAAELWQGTLLELLQFHQNRLRSEVRVESLGAGRYRLDVRVEGPDQWLRVPGRVARLQLERIQSLKDDALRSETKSLSSGDRLFPVQTGWYELTYR